jgi:hypothetical protein
MNLPVSRQTQGAFAPTRSAFAPTQGAFAPTRGVFAQTRDGFTRTQRMFSSFVIARRTATKQSISLHLWDALPVRAAACFSLARLAGESAPAGASEGVHPPAQSAAYFSLGVVSAGRLGKITVAALRMEQPPHPALRATLSRQAGEGNDRPHFAVIARAEGPWQSTRRFFA